jgi:hypothetical protein
VALLLLAGCASHAPRPASDDSAFKDMALQATATTGVIRGVVVDEAVRPLANATIALTGQKGGLPATASSNLQGAFAFDKLDPGTYFLQIHKLGYVTAQQSTDVVAGVSDPAVVKIQLVPDASFVKPFSESFVYDGFIQCSAGGTVDSGDYGIDNACSDPGVPPVPNPFSDDHSFVQYQLSGRPTWVQSEMVWSSTQAASKSLNLNFAIPSGDALANPDGWDDLSVVGQSPLLNTMDAKTADHYVDGNGTLTIRVFPWSDSYPGPVLALEQKFQVFTTVFYGYAPPAGWMLSNGDPVPAPPG